MSEHEPVEPTAAAAQQAVSGMYRQTRLSLWATRLELFALAAPLVAGAAVFVAVLAVVAWWLVF